MALQLPQWLDLQISPDSSGHMFGMEHGSIIQFWKGASRGHGSLQFWQVGWNEGWVLALAVKEVDNSTRTQKKKESLGNKIMVSNICQNVSF